MSGRVFIFIKNLLKIKELASSEKKENEKNVKKL